MTNSADQFETIVSEHYESLYRFAMSLTRAESDARDLTQHTFYVWATKGHQLRDASKIKTWLFTILHRAFLASRRRQTRFPHCALEDLPHEPEAPVSSQANYLAAVEVLPALAQVDEIYQAAVSHFYLEDCSYNEIAGILGIPVGTVKSRIARGVAQLKEILFRDDRGESFQSENAFQHRSAIVTSIPQPNLREWDSSPAPIAEPFGVP